MLTVFRFFFTNYRGVFHFARRKRFKKQPGRVAVSNGNAAELEQVNQPLVQQNQTLTQKNQELEQRVEQLEQTNQETEKKCRHLKHASHTLEQTKQELEAENRTLKQLNLDLEQKVLSLEQENQEPKKQDMERLEKEVKDKDKALSDMQKEKELKDEMMRLNVELATATADLRNTRENLDKYRTELQQSNEVRETYRKKSEELETKLAVAKAYLKCKGVDIDDNDIELSKKKGSMEDPKSGEHIL